VTSLHQPFLTLLRTEANKGGRGLGWGIRRPVRMGVAVEYICSGAKLDPTIKTKPHDFTASFPDLGGKICAFFTSWLRFCTKGVINIGGKTLGNE
jgi:hypothetical protein